jgi:hypothetical protein
MVHTRDMRVTRTLGDLTELRKKLERKIWRERMASWRLDDRKLGHHLILNSARGWHSVR